MCWRNSIADAIKRVEKGFPQGNPFYGHITNLPIGKSGESKQWNIPISTIQYQIPCNPYHSSPGAEPAEAPPASPSATLPGGRFIVGCEVGSEARYAGAPASVTATREVSEAAVRLLSGVWVFPCVEICNAGAVTPASSSIMIRIAIVF
jgi:hypothetical protein